MLKKIRLKNIIPVNKKKRIKLTVVAMLFSLCGWAQPACDLLIKNGKIIDGTGNGWYHADVAIKDGKILAIQKNLTIAATKTIDAQGLIVAPGFVDVHTHIEGDEAKTPTAGNFVFDGVTTVITGNCGSSNVDIGRYLQWIDSLQLSLNVASLVGHNDIRKAVMGRANRDATEQDLQQMEALTEKAMREGAVGLSTGLIYVPGTYSKTPEIVRLAKVAARFNGVYATHMRDEGDSVTQAIEEALAIGDAAQIPVEISHFKLSGQQNWGRSKETLPMVMAARQRGLDVTIDQYPYTASSTSLGTLLPDDVLADGQDSIVARLARPDIRQRVTDHILKRLKKRKLKHLSYAVVAYYKADTTLNGKSIEAINLLKGRKHKAREEAATVMEMMVQGGAGMVFHGMGEADVRQILQYPFNMFASDAGIREFGKGAPHPRGYGTNARVLGKYVREEKIISLEEAIRRMTSLPAQKFNLKNIGLLREGMNADVVVFDEKEVADKASFDNPHQYAAGFRFVIVNGQLVINNGTHTGVRSGKALYGPGMAKR
jgi:N-acyl-D-amino-acid deacylase